jgi:cyclic pyranopterin phosphate synthase
MPPEGVPERDHSEILSYEELAAVARAAVEVGISKVRITGFMYPLQEGTISTGR